MPSGPELPNNPLKRPFFMAMALVAAACGLLFGVAGRWLWLGFAIVVFVGACWCLWATRGGRNPRLFHAPLDRRWPRN